MLLIKGFISSPELADNTDGVVAPICELSTHAKTYSKDIKIYTVDDTSNTNGLDLNVFKAYDQTTGDPITVSQYLVDQVVNFSNRLISLSLSDSLNDVDHATLVTYLNTVIDSNSDVVNTTVEAVGDYIPNGQTGVIPNKVTLTVTENNTDYNFIIWYSNDVFLNEYDEYEIHTVMPLSDMDVFFTDESIIKGNLDAITAASMNASVRNIIGYEPDTSTQFLEFDWHDFDSDVRLTVTWPVVIYGAQGDTLENIKRQLREDILANSTRTESEWKLIFPGIFTNTEFFIVPDYASSAIPNETILTGINSPTINYLRFNEMVNILESVAATTEEHIVNNAVSTVHTYKSIALFIVGGDNNLDEKYNFKELWVDYFTIPSSDHDFSRMAPRTQILSNLLNEAIAISEDMTDFNTLPDGFSRVYKNGYMFASFDHENIQYNVLSRTSFEEIDGVIDDIIVNPPTPDPIPDPTEGMGQPMVITASLMSTPDFEIVNNSGLFNNNQPT